MAELIGLKIQGIRSVGDEAHVINFLHPLTIIQGPNGTGKTTIIEALNFITTGALPSGKLHAFIHNVRVANKSRVDALVQLQFKDIRGNKCTATKRMNLSTRSGKMAAKSDEFTIVVTDEVSGETKSLSSKVADFNREMLNLLGVPKAILEHVIFCHQEESNWPLNEPKDLKVRFDAIFEVTKYVKALDAIKKNIKELETQVKHIDVELPHLEANRQTKLNLERNLADSKSKHATNREAIATIRTEKRDLETRLNERREAIQQAQKAKYKRDLLFNQIKMKREFLASLDADGDDGADVLSTKEALLEEIGRLQAEAENSQRSESERQTGIRLAEQRVRAADATLQNAAKALAQREQSHNQLTSMLTVKQSQLEKHVVAINEAIGGVSGKAMDRSQVDVRLSEVQAALHRARADYGQIDGCRTLFAKWSEEARAQQRCPLCERKYTNKQDAATLAKKIHSKHEKLPEDAQALERAITAYEEEERRLLRVHSSVALADALEHDELPSLRSKIETAAEQLDKQRSAKQAAEAEWTRLREKLRATKEAPVSASSVAHELRVLNDRMRRLDLIEEVRVLESQLQSESEMYNEDDEELQTLLQQNDGIARNITVLSNKVQRLLGEQTQIEAKIREIDSELKNARYANAKQLEVDKLIEKTVKMATIEDLHRFWRVVDDAIINFHQQKMEQINQILQELWAQVYQASDIETIRVRSQPIGGESDKRKSYDYSVVMMVDGTEIEMRDHCSAGQKVLASILVRIALADVFAANCPVLALDEPTTNLDADKVENVGRMLKALIDYRNGLMDETAEDSRFISQHHHRNTAVSTQPRRLQLIVITHDRRLVDHLYLACRPEYIYGLLKDANGVSHIRKHKRVSDSLDYEETM